MLAIEITDPRKRHIAIFHCAVNEIPVRFRSLIHHALQTKKQWISCFFQTFSDHFSGKRPWIFLLFSRQAASIAQTDVNPAPVFDASRIYKIQRIHKPDSVRLFFLLQAARKIKIQRFCEIARRTQKFHIARPLQLPENFRHQRLFLLIAPLRMFTLCKNLSKTLHMFGYTNPFFRRIQLLGQRKKLFDQHKHRISSFFFSCEHSEFHKRVLH